MKIEYDPRADALYIYLKEDAEVAETHDLKPGIMVDYDREGNLVGIEILDVKKRFSKKDLAQVNLINLSLLYEEAA